MEGHVCVTVTTRSLYDGGEDVLVFTGSGLLKRTETGWHLRYTAKGEDGSPSASDVELHGSSAAVRNITGGYTLQLVRGGQAKTRIPTAAGELPITVVTKELNWALEEETSGSIQMHYQLLAQRQLLSEMHVSMQLTNK